MRQFVLVNLFFILFTLVVGGAMFLAILLVGAMHLPDDAERAAMPIAGILALIGAGLLMKQLHSMIQRRL